MGIDPLIADIVNRNLDYGTEWAFNDKEKSLFNEDDSIILRQLKYFYKKDLEKKYSKEHLYIKALYLHHLLDFFMETRVNILDIEQVFQKFLEKKVIIEYIDNQGNKINFQKDINEILHLIRKNKEELFKDLKGNYRE